MSAAVRTFGDPPRAIPDREVTRLMLEMLQLKPTDKLMEIGTGSASQTGIWAERCKEVHTVELKPFNRCDSLGNHVFFRACIKRNGGRLRSLCSARARTKQQSCLVMPNAFIAISRIG